MAAEHPSFTLPLSQFLMPGHRLPVLAFLIPKGLLLKVVSAMAGGARVVGERVGEAATYRICTPPNNVSEHERKYLSFQDV